MHISLPAEKLTDLLWFTQVLDGTRWVNLWGKSRIKAVNDHRVTPFLTPRLPRMWVNLNEPTRTKNPRLS